MLNKSFIKRNVSTPGLGRLARLDSIHESEAMQKILSGSSSALVYEVQVSIKVKNGLYCIKTKFPVNVSTQK